METADRNQLANDGVWQSLHALCTARTGTVGAALPLRLTAIDEVLPHGGLAADGVHEWIGVDHAERPSAPPLLLLSHLAGQAALADGTKHLIWIGEAVQPFAPTLGNLLPRSIFVRTANPGERLWAIDLALRSGAAACVIADGSRLDLSATRRLQLAAEAGGAICFLARPPRERAQLSAAATRWQISVMPHDATNEIPARRWIVELLRCKGVQPSQTAPRRWILEQSHATGDGLMASVFLDRSDSAAVERPRHRQSG